MSQAEKTTGEGRLFGDPSPEQLVERIIRVDQAGEYGAVRIYQGQRAVLGRSTSCGATLAEMEAQERLHLATFDALVAERKVRPTALQPLWHLAGFALGAGSALLGERAAMACTVAVEEVIEEHYARQAELLGSDEAALKDTIVRYRGDEMAHRATAIAQGAERAPGYPLMVAAIKAATRLAIRLSERL